MVMGGNSCSRDRRFKSRRDIFTHRFVKKIIVCLKRPKIYEKRPGLAHLKKSLSYFRKGPKRTHLNLLILCPIEVKQFFVT